MTQTVSSLRELAELAYGGQRPSLSPKRAALLSHAADELERLTKDAERYRWLRTRINWSDGEFGMAINRTAPIITIKTRSWTHCDIRPVDQRPASEHIDEYIDSVMLTSRTIK